MSDSFISTQVQFNLMSEYFEYSEYVSKILVSTRPSFLGFMRKYILCLAPLVALAIYAIIKSLLKNSLSVFNLILNLKFVSDLLNFTILLSILFIISWVLRSREVQWSVGLSLTISAIFVLLKVSGDFFDLILKGLSVYISSYPLASVIAVTLTILGTELYRRSIRYEITDTGIRLCGGICRRQEHYIPYDKIGRIVLEQSLFGRLLNYGTIIPVGLVEWGAEYYTRAIGVGSYGRVTAGVGYARTLKEISRDPLKCLYGVRDAVKIKEIVERMITSPFRAEVDQVEYLKKIYNEITRK